MYVFDRIEGNRVYFKRNRGYLAGWIFVVVGAAIALLPVFLGGTGELNPEFPVTILVCFGLAFVGAGLMALTAWRPPARLVLDGPSGVVRYESDREPGGEIPFAEFSAFESGSYITTNKNSTTTHYTFDLRKHDGTIQRLLDTLSRKKRDDQAEMIRRAVDLDTAAVVVQPPHNVSPPFELRRLGDKQQVTWTAPVQPLQLLALVLMLVGFAGVGVGIGLLILAQKEEDAFWGILFASVFVLVPGLIFGILLYVKLSAIGRTHMLEVTSSQLRYSTEGGLVGKGPAWTLPLSEVHTVALQPSEGKLICRTEAAPSGGTPSGTTSLSWKAKPGELQLGDLPLAPQLQLEQWLQAEIGKRTGRPLV